MLSLGTQNFISKLKNEFNLSLELKVLFLIKTIPLILFETTDSVEQFPTLLTAITTTWYSV